MVGISRVLLGCHLVPNNVAWLYRLAFIELGYDVKTMGSSTPGSVLHDFPLAPIEEGFFIVADVVEAINAVEDSWIPDLYVQVDESFRLGGVLNALEPFVSIPCVFLGTNNHLFNYRHPMYSWFDYRMVAHRHTINPSEYWLPLAFNPSFVEADGDEVQVWFLGPDNSNVLEEIKARYTFSFEHGDIAVSCPNTQEIGVGFFDVLGIGKPTVVKEHPWIGQLAVEGADCLTFQDADQCIAAIYALLGHRGSRERLGASGKYLVQNNHMYQHRVLEIVDTVVGGPEALRRY